MAPTLMDLRELEPYMLLAFPRRCSVRKILSLQPDFYNQSKQAIHSTLQDSLLEQNQLLMHPFD